MMLKKYFKHTAFVLLGCWCALAAQAQDPLFTQFYAAPLYLNPAFAGASGGGRIAANYRNQWPGLDANFVTYAATYDQFFERIRSGVGFMVKRDEQGGGATSPFIAQDLRAYYSYLIPLNDKLMLQPGLSAGYTMRDLNFNNFIFGDQLTDDGLTGGGTNERFPNIRRGHFDVGTGLLLYSEQFWAGISADHLSRPDIAFMGETERLDMRLSVHAGYKIPLMDTRGRRDTRNLPERSVTPAVMYLSQGKWDQLSVGGYFNYEPLVLGLWYRGLPVKRFENAGVNQDALAVEAGVQFQQFTIVYSYDYTVSGLNNVNTQGAHEVSVVFHFSPKEKGRPRPINYPRVDCPNPWKRFQRLRYEHVKP